jgi:hypothetical protein
LDSLPWLEGTCDAGFFDVATSGVLMTGLAEVPELFDVATFEVLVSGLPEVQGEGQDDAMFTVCFL